MINPQRISRLSSLILMSLLLVNCVAKDEYEQVVRDLTTAKDHISDLEDQVSDLDAEIQSLEEHTERVQADYNALVACADEIGCVEYGPNDPIRLASALAISGSVQFLGLDSQYGVELAIDFRESILGHEIELVAMDDGCSAEGGASVGEEIVADESILGVIGSSCSSAALTLSPIISEAGYFMISPSNTAPSLTDENEAWFPGYLRTSHNDAYQGLWMAYFAFNQLGLRSAAGIHDGDPYTMTIVNAFIDAFWSMGGEIVDVVQVNSFGDMKTQLLHLSQSGPPQIIYFPLFTTDCVDLTQAAMTTAGLRNTILAAADGCISDSIIQELSYSGEGMYLSGANLTYESDLYDDLLEAYEDEYGTYPISVFHPHAFDATNMVLDCIEDVAFLEPDGNLHIGRQAMRDCLYDTCGFVGITGELTCGESGECGSFDSIQILQLIGGEYQPVYP